MGSGVGPLISDLNRSSRSIFVSLALSVVWSILFIYFLGAFGETLAWICVVLIQILFIGIAGVGFYLWDLKKKEGMFIDDIDENKELIEKNDKE